MKTALISILVFCGVGIVVWAISFLVERLRPIPKAPDRFDWAPELQVAVVYILGSELRYVKSGEGTEFLLLLHTLRTQLDLFEKMIPQLSKEFTVYAFDYPGYGFSDIPTGKYDADMVVQYVEGFMDALNLQQATIVGVSIGASIALGIAGRRNARVARVVPINPYDYAHGRGMARSSTLGRMITLAADVPFVGETVMRLRNFGIIKAAFGGGVADSASIPPALVDEMYRVGNRDGHYQAFLSLLRNVHSWETANERCRSIEVPVLLLWGSDDWATMAERELDRELIPNVEVVII